LVPDLDLIEIPGRVADLDGNNIAFGPAKCQKVPSLSKVAMRSSGGT
jgi:hypothetical protein